MSDGDLYVSNGTCYFGRGQIADKHFIPCGNAVENGPQACCYEGGFLPFEQHMLGQHKRLRLHIYGPLIRNPNGKSSFDEIASLPQTVMGSISFNPTALPTRGTGDTSSSSSGTASASASIPGPTSGGSSGGASGLSHPAQIGVGVGVGVGGAILLTIIAFMVYKLRRQRKTAAPPQYETQPQQQQQQQQQHNQETRSQVVSPDPGNAGDLDRAQQVSPDLTTVRTNTVSPELDAGMWDKPELSGDPTTRSELPTRGATKREHVSELPGEI
ncbi:hypothetical protein PG996_001272 [Apiospora saccharicola]|uniref:Uncharacterized protein n=1 Tax=Apiospora saccharicola TaxID=335842 RepID=A0ABR1WJ21_9PEZI